MRFMSSLATVFFTLGISSTADAIGSEAIGIGISSGTFSGLYYAGLYSYSDTDYLPLNMPFPEAVEHPILQYKPILDDILKYDIYLDSSGLHWYVVIHADAPIGKFPYVAFEITRNNSLWSAIKGENSLLVTSTRIIPTEKGLYQSGGVVCPTLKGAGLVASMVGVGSMEEFMLNISGCYLPKKGTIRTTMRGLSEIAERVQQEMGAYNLYSSNCRHFANKFLSELGLPTTPDTMDKAFKKFHEMYDEIKKKYDIIRRKYDEYRKAFDEFKKEFDEIFDENEIVFIFLLLIELENEFKSFTYN